MKCCGMMRYGDDFQMPYIQRPLSYDFNSEGDYIIQISAAQQAGAPPVVIASYIYKYLKAIFYDNPNTAKAFDLIIAADRLFAMTKDQIQQALQRGLVEGWEVVLHDSALTFIAELIRQDASFLDKPIEDMIKMLVDLSKERTPATPLSPTRLSVADILANAND
jgi:hypothetical protein